MATFRSFSIVSFEIYEKCFFAQFVRSRHFIKKARLEVMSFVVHLSDFAEMPGFTGFFPLRTHSSPAKSGEVPTLSGFFDSRIVLPPLRGSRIGKLSRKMSESRVSFVRAKSSGYNVFRFHVLSFASRRKAISYSLSLSLAINDDKRVWTWMFL